MQSPIGNRAAKKNKHHRAFRLADWIGLFAVLMVPSLFAAETGRWHLMVEPSFMRSDFSIPIPGSAKTLVAPAIVRGDIVTFLDEETKTRMGLNPDSITRVAQKNASEELAKLTPHMLRDAKGVVQAVVIDSDRPVVAAATLAPDFIEKFEPVLGPDLLVAIPNRYRVYVYPALASKFEATAEAVLNDYRLTPYPVSMEVFRVTPGGLEAVGTFEPAAGLPANPF
jgi:hypothetical protein